MTMYRVATYVTVEAKDLTEAAQKAFVLHDEMTPEEFHITEADDLKDMTPDMFEVKLDEAQKEEAREQQRQGKFFPTTDLKD